MSEIFGIDKLFSVSPKNRLGKFREYGRSMFGFSEYGDELLYLFRALYGYANFGDDIFGNMILITGIYRRDNVSGYLRYYVEPYYITRNPRTASQQNWRRVFADAVASWQGLTQEEKQVYNKRAIGRYVSGYALFLKEYLLSH